MRQPPAAGSRCLEILPGGEPASVPTIRGMCAAAHRPADRNRLTASEWRAVINDAPTIERYYRHVFRRGPGQCFPWTGALSSSGHPRLRVSRALGSRVVSGIALGHQLSRGPLRLGPDGTLPVIRHTCDLPSCCQPAHWITGTAADNAADYASRRYDPLSPLADVRSPAGRARAIRAAILDALAAGAGPEQIEREIRRAEERGMKGHRITLW